MKRPKTETRTNSLSAATENPYLIYNHHNHVTMSSPPSFPTAGAQKTHHKTLSAYYKTVLPISQYLINRYSDTRLFSPDDIEEYKLLLSGYLCATLNEETESDKKLLTMECEGTQQEAIDAVLRELSRQGRKMGKV